MLYFANESAVEKVAILCSVPPILNEIAMVL